MGFWLKRETGKESVTLTFVTISFVLYASTSLFHALGIISGVSELGQLFMACLAGYVGRKINFKGSSEVNSDESKKEEKDEAT